MYSNYFNLESVKALYSLGKLSNTRSLWFPHWVDGIYECKHYQCFLESLTIMWCNT